MKETWDNQMVSSNTRHIHIWNAYTKDNRLCCSTCGLTYNKYLQEDDTNE